MFQEEINDVYNKLDELLKLKLKPQIKGTDLNFEKLFHVKNLVSNKEYYLLYVNNKGIQFTNTSEFYSRFSKVIEEEIVNAKNELSSYEYHRNHDLEPPHNIDYILEKLSYQKYKLDLLLKKIKSRIL